MKKPASIVSIPALVCGEIGLVQSLGVEDIPVYATSNYPENIGMYSKYVKQRINLPPYDTEQFIEMVCEFGKKLTQKAVMFTDEDSAVLAISRNRDRLKNYYYFMLPDRDIVEVIQNKKKFYQEASKHGLPVPASFTVSSLYELHVVEPRLTYPCILKPVYTEDWLHKGFSKIVGPYKKAIRCTGPEELFSLYEKISRIHPTAIIQDYVEGEDHQHYSINMYIGRNGELKGYYIYRKVRMYPIRAGRGCYFVTIYDDEILTESLEVVDSLNLCGLINIQFKRDTRTGNLRLIEIECRLSVSNFLGPASGMNLARLYYYDLVGKPYPIPERYETGVKYFDLLRDIKAYFQYRKQDDLSFKEWLQSYQGKFVCNGYRLSDPYPVVMDLWFILRRKLNGKSNRQRFPLRWL